MIPPHQKYFFKKHKKMMMIKKNMKINFFWDSWKKQNKIYLYCPHTTLCVFYIKICSFRSPYRNYNNYNNYNNKILLKNTKKKENSCFMHNLY